MNGESMRVAKVPAVKFTNFILISSERVDFITISYKIIHGERRNMSIQFNLYSLVPEPEPPFVPIAGVGSGISRAGAAQKKWWLCNTVKNKA